MLADDIKQCDVPQPFRKSLAVFVEGLETFAVLNRKKRSSMDSLEQFVYNLSSMSTMSTNIKQISLMCVQELLTPEVMFSLQKVSTCLTTLSSQVKRGKGRL